MDDAKQLFIDEPTLAEIKRLRAKQDQNARGLGTLVWEHADERAKLEARHTAKEIEITEFIARLGGLDYDFNERRRFWLDTIHRTAEEQKAVGELALKGAGLPEQATFTIDEATGRILAEGPNGSWVPATMGVAA